MAISIVAGSNKVSTTGTITAQAPVAGNVIVLYACNRATTVTVSSVSQTNVTWTFVGRRNSAAPSVEIWYGVVGASPGTSITVSWSSGTSIAHEIVEVSGLNTASPVDGAVATSGGNTTPLACAAYSNTNADDIIVAMDGSSGTTIATGTGTGWTDLTGTSAGSGSTGRSVKGSYKIVSVAGAQSQSYNISGNNATIIVGLKMAAATGTGPGLRAFMTGGVT